MPQATRAGRAPAAQRPSRRSSGPKKSVTGFDLLGRFRRRSRQDCGRGGCRRLMNAIASNCPVASSGTAGTTSTVRPCTARSRMNAATTITRQTAAASAAAAATATVSQRPLRVASSQRRQPVSSAATDSMLTSHYRHRPRLRLRNPRRAGRSARQDRPWSGLRILIRRPVNRTCVGRRSLTAASVPVPSGPGSPSRESNHRLYRILSDGFGNSVRRRAVRCEVRT